MSEARQAGRLSTIAAAWVVARRDFAAILFSRTFLFFLLGPLFPVLVGVLAGSLGERVQQVGGESHIGLVMRSDDVDAMLRARERLSADFSELLPDLLVIRRLESYETFDARQAFDDDEGKVAAVLSGTPEQPVLTGPDQQIERWRGPVTLIASEAASTRPLNLPQVRLVPTASSEANDIKGRVTTGQGAQTLLFLLTMMLAGMVLSNLVEEKGNKIIEVLAAAVPMDAVFLGKLFAMLAVSFVGIAVWGAIGGALWYAAGSAVPDVAAPAVGWPMLFALGVAYFAMAYLLLGSVFLAIGSMASTVREVQTLSLPVTMMQLLVFFLASFAMTRPGSAIEIAAALFPFSSPFAMLARAAQESALTPHLVALAWQAAWVILLVRVGARLFRTRVMKAGPAPERKRRGLKGLTRRSRHDLSQTGSRKS